MGLNLYPFNYYILWAAVILLVVMLVLTGVHSIPLLKALNERKKQAEPIQHNVQLAKIKVEAMKEKKAEDDKKNRIWKLITPFALAVYEAYRQDQESSGVSGLEKAAHKVMNDMRYQKRLKNAADTHL